MNPIHRRRWEIEEALDPSDLILLDTAVPDTLVYALLFGAPYRHIADRALHFGYRQVFVLDLLPLKVEPVREPIADHRAKIDVLTEAVYRALGYRPIRVPALPRPQRVKQILQYITKKPAP